MLSAGSGNPKVGGELYSSRIVSKYSTFGQLIILYSGSLKIGEWKNLKLTAI